MPTFKERKCSRSVENNDFNGLSRNPDLFICLFVLFVCYLIFFHLSIHLGGREGFLFRNKQIKNIIFETITV